MNLDSPQARYAMLRSSLELFHTPPGELDDAQKRELHQQINGELAIAKRMLEREEAAQVVIPDSSVKKAYDSLRRQFDSEQSFEETLAYNRLSVDSLCEALRHELHVEAALEQLLGEKSLVSDEEVEIYYLKHQTRFQIPETRSVAHILITINDDYAENSREQVTKRISRLREQCAADGNLLKQLAARHSECPSAMKNGLIGRVKSGQLYPQLDTVLFKMEAGEVSEVVETEVGLHLLYCEAVHPAETLPFDKVKEKIYEMLEQKSRARVLKEHLSK